MKSKFRLLINRVVSYRLYTKYVSNNAIILMDIQNTMLLRNCKDKGCLFKNFSHLLLHYPEFAFVFFKRIGFKSLLIKKFYNSDKYMCKIFGSTKIKGGFVCFHPYATVINAKSIGENFVFRNSITIGNKNNDNTLLPVIGNNVEVGANAVIIGMIEIGDNVIIGAGAVVTKNIPHNSVAYGNPIVIKKRNEL